MSGKYEYCGYCKDCVCDDINRIDNDGKYYCKDKKMRVYPESSPLTSNCFMQVASYNLSYRDAAFKKSKEIRSKSGESVKMPYEESFQASGCYITTIVVNILGKDDDCPELQVLRKFRSEYMQKNEGCKSLLIKYDVVGPLLAHIISIQENARDFAQELYNIYIKGAATYVQLGEFDRAIDLYVEMTNNLIDKFSLNYIIGERIDNIYDIQNSGHGKIAIKS